MLFGKSERHAICPPCVGPKGVSSAPIWLHTVSNITRNARASPQPHIVGLVLALRSLAAALRCERKKDCGSSEKRNVRL